MYVDWSCVLQFLTLHKYKLQTTANIQDHSSGTSSSSNLNEMYKNPKVFKDNLPHLNAVWAPSTPGRVAL